MADLIKQNSSLWGDDIPFLAGLRDKALYAFNKFGLPTKKTEAWKYSALKWNNFEFYLMPEEECDGHCHCCEHHESASPILSFCNGKPKHGFEHKFPNGLTVMTLAEAIYEKEAQKYLNKSYNMEKFPFAALNTAYLEDGAFIVVERNTKLKEPIVIKHNAHKENVFCNIHNIIVLENNAEALIVEDFSGEDQYFCNIVNEFFVGANAVCKHSQKISESPKALHIALNSIIVKSDGFYKGFIQNGNSELIRRETFVQLQNEGASAQVDGIYKLKENAISDITTNVRHLAPHTTSNQLVKGVAEGKTKGVFQGQIHIAPNAQQTEGYQLHRALLLSDNAEINCKPELEIFADDVKCSHGAVCGDLDKEQLFYMQSRGIDLESARKILIDAYFQEVLERNADMF